MPRILAPIVLTLAVSLFAACSFSLGPQYEFDKASPLVADANKLNTDAASLLGEALGKYDEIYSEAQKADDPFEELGAKDADFKKLEPQLETAKGKLKDASSKLTEAAKMKLPDWYTQYLTTLSDINKSGSETADLALQLVKNTYDPNIHSPEDLDAKQKVLQDKLAAETKRRDALRATQTKIETEHKDQFKS
jgi:hypothetical protein